MADFTLSQISGPSGGGPTPQSPVQGPSTAGSVLSGVASIAQAGFQGAAAQAAEQRQRAQAEVQAQGNKTVSRFATQQMEIADAVDRGDMSSQQARRQMRINLSRALADNPSFQEDIRKAHGDVLGTAGMGKVAAEGTQQEQAFFDVMNEATGEGWITPDMSQEESQNATLDYMAWKRTQNNINAQQNEIALKRAQLGYQTDQVQATTARISQQSARLGLQSAQIDLANSQAQRTAQQNMGNLNNAYMPKFQRQTNQIIEQFESGQLTAEQANRELDNMEIQYQATASQLGANLSTSYLDNLAAPYQAMTSSAREVISGARALESYRNRANAAVAQAQLQMSGDPDLVESAAALNMFPSLSSVQTMAGGAVSRKLNQISKGKVSGGDLTDPEETESNQATLQTIRESLSTMSSGIEPVTDGQRRGVETSINTLLRGVDAFGSSVDDPSQLNEYVGFFASDEYGRYVSGGATGISSANANTAEQVIQAQYTNVVAPLVRQEFENAMVGMGTANSWGPPEVVNTERPASQMITPEWSGSGLVFRAGQDVPASLNNQVKSKVRELNRRVSPVVNKLVKAGAHLSGNTNYERVYNGQFAPLFSGGSTEAQEQSD